MFLTKIVPRISRCGLVKNINNAQFKLANIVTRFFSDEDDECPDNDEILCCGTRLLKKDACPPAIIPKKKEEEKKPAFPFKDLFPDCCEEPCPEAFPRFDDLYYSASNKAKRIYNRTWIECPQIKCACKKACLFENIKPPPLNPRKPKQECKGFAKSACSRNKASDLKLLVCKKPPPKTRCSKIMMPGCKAVRKSQKCVKPIERVICKKRCTPYPSFSECQKPPMRPRRGSECYCNETKPICETWAELKKDPQLNKKC